MSRTKANWKLCSKIKLTNSIRKEIVGIVFARRSNKFSTPASPWLWDVFVFSDVMSIVIRIAPSSSGKMDGKTGIRRKLLMSFT